MTRRLSLTILATLPVGIDVPSYDRARVAPGIVHLGVGAFHRGHQAVFIDDCLNRGEEGWGIIAASLRRPDTKAALAPQDNLYTLALRDGSGERLRVVGSILDTIVAPEEPGKLLHVLADPRIRIVTLTVTEKGYTANLASRSLLRDHPDVVHDLANPGAPRTVLGYLTEAIRMRRDAGIIGLTLLSCDNLPSNGKTLLKVLCEFATLRDPELGAYVAEHIACPSSMVDRIVPATTDLDRERLSAALGAEDAWPVVAEPFFQWVIEDRFPQGRPALEQSGVEFVANVEPFEHMKLRLLNGAHTIIAAIGQITGLPTVSDVFTDVRVRRLIDFYWRQVAPTLDPLVDAAAYTDRLRTRFDNPSLKHRAEQIATDASLKVPQRILVPLQELLEGNRPAGAPIFALALWIRSCAGMNERGERITVNDPAFHDWSAKPDQVLANPATTVRQFLEFGAVFGSQWREKVDVVAAMTAALTDIRQFGVLKAIEQNFPA
jgi:fructuronate reductase